MVEVIRSVDCLISIVCVFGLRNLVKMEYKIVIVINMCGNLFIRYCLVKFLNKCDWCNESDYIVDKMIDDDVSIRW